MSRKTRGRIRTLFAVPSAAVLVLGASQAFASPTGPARLPECIQFCAENEGYCTINPGDAVCRACGCFYG
jgi:hypothetical protein